MTLLLVFCLYASLIPAAETPGQFAIASAHPLATDAGQEIFKAGGNAFDAAVAISAVLAVVEPYSSGIGGGGFWLLYSASDQKRVMLDGREMAPSSASRDMFLDKTGAIIPGKSINGVFAAGIPGVPAALVHLNEKYGNLSLAQDLAPAIRYAREGFRVTALYQHRAKYRLDVLRNQATGAAIFLQDNDVPHTGHLIKQPDLAHTLELIAENGRAGFYAGETADKLVTAVNNAGGHWSLSDLTHYQIVERKPVIANYRGYTITSASPPSSGGIVLAQSLAILEKFDLGHVDAVTRKHLVIEALRRAYRDRAAYLGDPDFVKIPLDRILDSEYLAGLADSISMSQATPSAELGDIKTVEPSGHNTTHFSVLDAEGNRVAATLSINLPFGSGFVATGTGVLLNDEMDDFSIKPLAPNSYGLVGDEANSIAPGKRPLSSMTPTFVENRDRVGILGTPGGSRIISMVLLGVLEMVDGKLPGDWVKLPRYHHQYLPDEVMFEKDALSGVEQQRLRDFGYKLHEMDRKYGNMQAILWYKPKDLVFAASDPRGEGKSVVSDVKDQPGTKK